MKTTLTLAPHTAQFGFLLLSAEGLDSDQHQVDHSCGIRFEYSQIWLNETMLRDILLLAGSRNGLSFSQSRDGKHIVYPIERL